MPVPSCGRSSDSPGSSLDARLPLTVGETGLENGRPGTVTTVSPASILRRPLHTSGSSSNSGSTGSIPRANLTQLLELLFLAWFFASPVLYPLSFPRENLPDAAFTLYELNPVVGAMSLVRAALLQESLDPWTVGLSTLSAAALLVLGWRVFRRLEPRFSTAV